ncbi:MAG: DNA gyrase C-terminal beta-propeller domain-containing protein, partial [Thermocrinis sp.]|uniref:DNA gyrase C-terminal beta-propeller domain-containing protein n=1 Tax=Thermocrinis sp. TaxID=2024383 RepID=UPI003C0BAF26
RRSKYYLKKAEERLHIVKGLLIALSHLDQVIQDIKSSKDTQEAKEKLIKKYSLTEVQANAVLDLRLQRLTSLERQKLEEEEKELLEKIDYYTRLVESEEEKVKVFIEEMTNLSESFPAVRRTFVEGVGDEQRTGSITVVVFSDGKVMPLTEIEEGEVVNILDVSFDDGLFMVSNRGRVYWVAGLQALQGSKVSFKEPEERLVGAFVRSQAADRLLLATSEGYVKKIPLVDFEYKAQGTNIIKLTEDQGDVVKVLQSPEEGDLLIFTKMGKILRFPVAEISPATIGSKGVVGIKLDRGDKVVGMRVLRGEKFLLIITEKGTVQKIASEYVPRKSRGSKGLSILTRGRLVDILPLGKGQSLDLMLITQEGSGFYDRVREEELPSNKTQKRWNAKTVKVVIK